MKLLKVNNKYYHILHQFEVKFFDNVVMEYVINHNYEIIYFTNHDWWGNKSFWTIDEVSEKIKEIEVRKYRNPEIKQSRLNHWNRALQHMTDYTRDNKIEKIISEPFVWKFA
jgi:hypothetical protein